MGSSHGTDAGFGGAGGQAGERSSQAVAVHRLRLAGLERVLLVEPDEARRAQLSDAVRGLAEIDSDADFPTARAHLFSKPYDWLVTNSRLGAYNGLHLVHLAGTSALPLRFLIYADQEDVWLAREAQRAGAFYESLDRLDRALCNYLRGALPPQAGEA
jgi:DNA-binding NtrC family response regulator